jgi:hypothetical protein
MSSHLREVFGVRVEPVLSYVERPDVDDRFVAGLATDKQIVVYGASKQGKTALVTKHLPYEKCIVVRVGPKTEIVDIYKSILRQVGVKILSTTERSNQTEAGVSIGAKVKAFIPLFGGGEAEAKGEFSSGSSTAGTYEEISLNLGVPQDVSELLTRIGKHKTIVIENFHYLDDARQSQFSFDLRTFQELGIRFVVLGVWREKNRLAQFNGDLLDRVIEIPVEPWAESDFVRVADAGAQRLNIEFAPYIITGAINTSFGSIGVFQELLLQTCLHAGIHGAQPICVRLENQIYLDKAIRQKADDYSSRHQRVLEAIAAGNIGVGGNKDSTQSLCLPYYLVKILLSGGFDGLKNGMLRATIHEQIQAIHHRPENVRPSDMSNLLHNLAGTQSNKGISPPIFDYDRTNRQLQVVDSTFYFFLKNADLDRISQDIPNPMGI